MARRDVLTGKGYKFEYQDLLKDNEDEHKTLEHRFNSSKNSWDVLSNTLRFNASFFAELSDNNEHKDYKDNKWFVIDPKDQKSFSFLNYKSTREDVIGFYLPESNKVITRESDEKTFDELYLAAIVKDIANKYDSDGKTILKHVDYQLPYHLENINQIKMSSNWDSVEFVADIHFNTIVEDEKANVFERIALSVKLR